MKRFFCLFILAVMIAGLLPLSCFAQSAEENTAITYFADGSYMVEAVNIRQTRASGTVTGSKEKTYYGEDGVAEWKAVLTGSFTYTGSSATCNSSTCNVTIYDSTWYTISKSATKSGNTANASVTMGKKYLGITVTQVPTTVTLKCDANGNLS